MVFIFETASDDNVITFKRGDCMKIGFIGAGKVATVIGKNLTTHGFILSGFYSKSLKSSKESAEFTNSNSYDNVEDLICSSDILFISTPDGEIKNVWNCIKQYDLRQKIVCHFSGALSSDIFSNIEDTGATGCSFHPVYAFSDKFSSYKQFYNIYFVAQGNEHAVSVLKDIFTKCGHKILSMKGDKRKYHAAMVFSSNLCTGLIASAVDILGECGFSSKESLEILRDLSINNLKSVFDKGPNMALTGPIERNDIDTVMGHLQVLNGLNKDIYKTNNLRLTQLAMSNHPDRDYTKTIELLKSDK